MAKKIKPSTIRTAKPVSKKVNKKTTTVGKGGKGGKGAGAGAGS
jgi:hypothetical protein